MALYKGTEIVAGLSTNTIVTGFNVFDCKWSDHIINDIQWLRGDTFSWQSGDVYVTAYNTLVEEYSTGVEEVEADITFKRSANNFKIATPDMEEAILNKYNTDGIAWYYILDTENKQFKLPRTKFGFEGLRTNAGSDIAESLPNIKGDSREIISNQSSANGAFNIAGSRTRAATASGSAWGGTILYFDAARSSSTYQDGAPVQERATQMYLYFYVGEYAREAIEQTAGISSEMFNNKADTNLFNISNEGRKVIDGQWVRKSLTLASTTSAGTFTYDLSEYLPDTNHIYEIRIHTELVHSGASGGGVNQYVYSDVITEQDSTVKVGYVVSGSTASYDTFTLPAKQYIYVYNDANRLSRAYVLLAGYRRLGTNQ